MKTRQYLFILVLLLAIFMAACSSQAAPTETMSNKDMEVENTTEIMEEKDDDMMADKNEDDMSEHDDGGDDTDMSDHAGDDMDDDSMMEDKDDDMMSDKDDEMDDHDEMMDDKEDSTMSEDKGGEMDDDSMMMSPDWFKASLSNVNTGESFTISDLEGKVILVETLAMWCSNCLKQQGQVQGLHDLVGERDDFVSLGIDIDPNENADALNAYTNNNGFNWLYTVAPTEVSREIGKLYGDQFLNPPSTPMLIIDRDGDVHLLPFGIKSAEDLLEALQPFLDTEM